MASEACNVHDGEYSTRCGISTYLAQTSDFVFNPRNILHNYQSGPNGGKVLVSRLPDLKDITKRLQIFLISGMRFNGMLRQQF
jgi:hypothetical protein